METPDLVKQLKNLVQLDIDAIHAYGQAIEKIDLMDVKTELNLFRSDHQRHVDNLSPVIRRYGGEPPEFKRDFKGFLIVGMTALRSVTGTEGALKAMKTNEELTNRDYQKVLELDLPEDVRTIVRENREDERRHLEYVVRAIDQRVWEEKAA